MWAAEKDRDMVAADCSACHPQNHELCRCDQLCNRHQREQRRSITMQITEDAPIEMTAYRSKIDGSLVVEIDTQDDTGELRIHLNDGLIWSGDPESTTSARQLLIAIEAVRKDTHKIALNQQPADLDAQFRERVERILNDAGVRGWSK